MQNEEMYSYIYGLCEGSLADPPPAPPLKYKYIYIYNYVKSN